MQCGSLSRLLGRPGFPICDFPVMFGNYLPTAINRLVCACLNQRRRFILVRSPARFEVLKSRRVKWVIETQTQSFQRHAVCNDFTFQLCDPLLLSAQPVPLVLDDLIGALVLAANLLEKPLKHLGIFNALRSQLPQRAGGTLQYEFCQLLWIVAGGNRLSFAQPLRRLSMGGCFAVCQGSGDYRCHHDGRGRRCGTE